jgi:hypothetical protein
MTGSSPTLTFAQKILSQDMLKRCSDKAHIDFTLGGDAAPLNANEAIALAWALRQDKVFPESVNFKLASDNLRDGGVAEAFLETAKQKATLRKVEVNGGVSDKIQLYLERNNALQSCSEASLAVGAYRFKPTNIELKALALALQHSQSRVSSVAFSYLSIGLQSLLQKGDIEQAFFEAFDNNPRLVALTIDGEVSDRLRDVVKRNAFLSSKHNNYILKIFPEDNPTEVHLTRLAVFLKHPGSNVCSVRFQGKILVEGKPLNLIEGALEEAFYQLAVGSSRFVSLICWSGVSPRLERQLAINKMQVKINGNRSEKSLTFAKNLSPLELKTLLDLLKAKLVSSLLETITFSGLRFNYDFKEGEFEEMLFSAVEVNEALYEVRCKNGLSDRIKAILANRRSFCEIRAGEAVEADADKVTEAGADKVTEAGADKVTEAGADEPRWPALAALTGAVSSMFWSKGAADGVPAKAPTPMPS